ncbi:helix-hairpin-helix domain-containing protein [Oryzihumus sp.]
MRSRNRSQDQVADVARRRLELLGAELAGIRPGPESASLDGPTPAAPGEPRVRLLADAPWPSVPFDADPDQPVAGSPVPAAPGRHLRRPVGPAARAGAWVGDRLPAPLQGRVRVGSSQLTVVALLVATALALTAWWVAQAGGAGTPLPAAGPARPLVTEAALSSPAPKAATPAASAVSGEPSPTGTVVVDVTGKVRRPGIATLPAGSRVVDALKAAGGARPGVSLASLNLARVLTDGEQVVVGAPAPAGVAAPAASAPTDGSGPTTLVNVNTADQSALETLPGVGPVTAQKILAWRSDNGPFTAVDDLLDVSGIGEATLAEMAPFVTL